MTSQISLTREGLERLQHTLQHEQQRLLDATRVLSQQSVNATDLEDTGLEDARREKLRIEARIGELEEILARAVLLEGAPDADLASLGALVVLFDQQTQRELRLRLVSSIEASVGSAGLPLVSDESPVGRALLGRRVGEVFVVQVGPRQVQYQLRRIEP